ncbi:proline dehydrogenase family protein [Chryseobacterium sp. YR221]|uniref:proline dehydrogenase family protein n=1 Tax=Chryseobacterium sp. YR221 TaxID=1500293 RepID=UPI0009D8B17D|nr:proline dehydrogenase family protein [Chryseobacterium sp. YR221]SMC79699.1 L-proline dehydrogenase [Chryseobacterium sp. YR221]
MELKEKAGALLKIAALNEGAKEYILNNPELFKLLLKAAKRYIGGEKMEEALATAKRINDKGLPTSLEFMGESTRSVEESELVTQHFFDLINKVKEEKINSIVSLDLSHIGLAIDKDLAYNNLVLLAESAHKKDIEIVISAEGVDRTDDIINTYCKISPDFSNVGITLQAYLNRTPKDLERVLNETQGKIRIVKGAFAVPPGHAVERGKHLDDLYINYIETLFLKNRRCSIATHHNKIQNRVKELIEQYDVPKSKYEFEMLLGIQEDLLNETYKEGYSCRQYIVYGDEWYLYMCNRIAENPDNLFQAIVDIMS